MMRNSNIELLRIISTFMVLILHCLDWSGALNYVEGIDYYLYWGFEALSIVAVNVFVLINGYFMINSSFKFKSFFKISVSGVLLYSIIFSLINIFVSGEQITISHILKMCFPITTKKFWFVNSYLALYLISPFLNKLIHSISKKALEILIFILVLLFSVRVSFLPLSWSQDSSGGMGIIWFVVLYILAAYIRLWYQHQGSYNKYIVIYFCISFFILLMKKVLIIAGINIDLSSKFYGYSSITVLSSSVMLFLYFIYRKPMPLELSKIINKIARHSFSVYIIHFSILSVLWTNILQVHKHLSNPMSGCAYILFLCVVIYVFCTLIDIIKTFLGRKIMNVISNKNIIFKLYDSIEETFNKYERLINSI